MTRTSAALAALLGAAAPGLLATTAVDAATIELGESVQLSTRVKATVEGRSNALRDRIGNETTIGSHEVEAGLAASFRLRDQTLGTVDLEVATQFVREYGGARFKDGKLELNEAYYGNAFDDTLFSLGRKRLRWGVGYVSSPTDIVSASASPIDPDDRFFRIRGRDMVHVLTLSESSSIDLALVREEEDALYVEDHALLARGYLSFDTADVALVGGIEEDGDFVVGANTAVTVGNALELHGEIQFDSDIAARLPRLGPDGRSRFPREQSVQGLLGGQWTSESNVNVVLEYLYFGKGIRSAERETVLRRRALAGAATGSVRGLAERPLQTHYLFARVAKDNVFRDFDAEWILFGSLHDASHFQRLRLSRELTGNLSAYGDLVGIAGGDDSEFGQSSLELGFRLGLSVRF